MDWFRRQKVRNALMQNFSDFEAADDDGDFDLLEILARRPDGSPAPRAPPMRCSGRRSCCDRGRGGRLAGASTRSLPAALLGGIRCGRDSVGHGLLGRQCQDSLFAGGSCAGQGAAGKGNHAMNKFLQQPFGRARVARGTRGPRLAARLNDGAASCPTTSASGCALRASARWSAPGWHASRQTAAAATVLAAAALPCSRWVAARRGCWRLASMLPPLLLIAGLVMIQMQSARTGVRRRRDRRRAAGRRSAAGRLRRRRLRRVPSHSPMIELVAVLRPADPVGARAAPARPWQRRRPGAPMLRAQAGHR